jgi:phosphate transport system substrate-binding protein
MNKMIVLLSLFLATTSLAKERLVVTGSSTIAPVMSDLAKLYEKSHPKMRIDVQTGGSSRGLLDARRGVADIGMVSRALKSSESDLHGFVLGLDGLAIIVHKSNPIKNLSREQIVSIYRGKIKNWKGVGGKDFPIVVVNKAEGRSTLELFLKFFKLKNSQIAASIIIGDNEQGIKTVSGNKNSIAYVSVGAAEYNASVGANLKLLPFEGVQAKVENIEKGSYPLMRSLNMVTKLKPSGNVLKFINFVLSPDAHKIIREHYFVPINKNKSR